METRSSKSRFVRVAIAAWIAVSAGACTENISEALRAGASAVKAPTGAIPGGRPPEGPTPEKSVVIAQAPVAQITILGTNDIHGGIEAGETREGQKRGGMAFFGGVVRSIRQSIKARLGDQNGGVLVLDGGDQFQGTLLSNFDEGKLLYSAMSAAGYDAVVPGNHDYDFGPVGWTVDQKPETDEESLRGAFRETLKQANFSVVSANTFYKNSIVDAFGTAIPVNGTGCVPVVAPGGRVSEIDWSQAKTLDFLKPYVIKEVAGVRVAIVGLDHPSTPTVTTPHNVSDLCFADEAESYMRVRKQLDGKADVFVIVIHNGNINADNNATGLLEKLTRAPDPVRGAVVDAVVAGHTHQVNNVVVKGVPAIQSGANGTLFGRIDLFYDRATGKVDASRTRRMAGIQMLHESCPPEAMDTCAIDPASGKPAYDGVPVVQDAKILELIAERRQEIAPIAGRRLGVAHAAIGRGGAGESPLSNQLTDYLRVVSGAEISFMNTGGIRTDLNPRGLPNQEIIYENLFQVLPFSNRGVVLHPMEVDRIASIITRNAKSCSGSSGMAQSGLRVIITRTCKDADGRSVAVDEKAVVTRVETLGGELVIEKDQIINPGRTFKVATLDFLQAGGSGYTQFAGVPQIADLGIVRDAIADFLAADPVTFSNQTDGRWKIVSP